MKPLDGCKIALACAAGTGVAPERVQLLQRAGAAVSCCTISQDLWSTLSEGGIDLVVVLGEQPDPPAEVPRGAAATSARALLDQLRSDPRTAAIPSLLFAVPSAGTSALQLDATVDDEGFVRSLQELAAPQRRLRDAADLERALREQLARELARHEHHEQERSELHHELRAMLNAGLGFASNMRDELTGPLSSDQRKHVAGVIDAVDRANKLIDKNSARFTPSRPVLMAPTPASAPPRAQRTLVQLARVAGEVCALFEAVAGRKSTRLKLDCDDSVCVWGDALKLKQVLTNLVVNAIKYCPDRSHVTVHVGWTEAAGSQSLFGRRAAEMAVIDDGPGIAADQRERIFARGYRIDRHSEVPGEGIGLAVVKEIVAQHAGAIRVEGELGRGAVFRIWLPQDRRQRARGGEE